VETLLGVLGAIFLVFGLFGLFAAASPVIVAAHLLAAAVLLIYAGARSARRLSDLMGSSTARGGANVVVQTALILAIAGLLAWLSTRPSMQKHWDWTEAQTHSLSQGTIDTLAAIPEDGLVEMYAFFTSGAERQAKDELEKYTYASPRVKVRYLDPNQNPGLAQKFQIANQEGVVVVCNGPCETAKGTVKATEVSEQGLTRAVRQAVSAKKKIYFLKGHGEASPSDEKGAGASAVRGGLEDENVTVAELLLANEKEVPADASAVVIAGPDHAVSDRELELLDAYLQKGGSLLVLADPALDTNLEGQLAKWGIELGPEIVVEQQLQLFAGPQLGVQPVVTSYGTHPITEKLAGQPTVFRIARPVRKAEGADVTLTELATTSAQSWGESDVKGLLASQPVGLDPATDRPGPIALGVARELAAPEAGKRGGRLVVFGDSDFMRNRYVTQFYNGDLFLNAASWLTGSEEFATIERKRPRVASVSLTLEQFADFRFLALFALPEAILLLGVVNWWRRRT
jgi:ABC-type uncharacterized transport system involved in gliding motility auxiliary subunit